MAELDARPVLDHVLRRASRSHCLDTLVLATTNSPADAALLGLARRHGATVVRGSEDDVLSRFVTAAEITRADVIVRMTADCPLIDPRLIDRVVRTLLSSGADYAGNVEPPSYPDGYDVEAMTSTALKRIAQEATRAYEREHVTAVARENPTRYKHARVVCRRDYSGIRLTLDVPADLERIEAVIREAGHESVGLGGVLAALRRRPSLLGGEGLPARDERYIAQRAAPAASGDS
jgi:spore coat polysaccharide biosynthesis protein SpsF (cytidylyltransferase family)